MASSEGGNRSVPDDSDAWRTTRQVSVTVSDPVIQVEMRELRCLQGNADHNHCSYLLLIALCCSYQLQKIFLADIPNLSATFPPSNIRNDLMVQESQGEPSLWNRVSAKQAKLHPQSSLHL